MPGLQLAGAVFNNNNRSRSLEDKEDPTMVDESNTLNDFENDDHPGAV
jgi:hypothetical protein